MAEKYAVGIQSFQSLKDAGCVYVDKTHHIYNLLKEEGQKSYFLSRPRRFGKSLLVSTLKCIFQGKKHLFEGLYIHDKLDWQPCPVIHLSMSDLNFVDLGLREVLRAECASIAAKHGLELPGKKSPLRELLEALHEKYGQKVAILIDEYDKPIIHGLEAGDSDLAEKNRDILKNFYSGLKDADDFLRFLFITGVSKFAKVSIFSDLNHLSDLTLHKDYTTLCGYSQAELEHYHPEGLARLAAQNGLTPERCLAKVKEWYNGFSWDGENTLYNPFSTLQLLASSQFSNYWFATGTPTFLVRMMRDLQEYNLENLKVRPEVMDTFDLRRLNHKSLLWQTGYLAVKRTVRTEGVVDYYVLGVPNKEVRESYNQMLLGEYNGTTGSDAGISVYEIREAFLENDLESVKQIIASMFHALPAELYEKKDASGRVKAVGENFYHAIIYLIFNLLGVKMQAEVSVKNGKIDAVVETPGHVYLFEFKKDRPPEEALAQIRQNEYFGKYAHSGRQIHLVGVRFSLEERGIDAERDWVVEELY